jgi:hypothetical protein
LDRRDGAELRLLRELLRLPVEDQGAGRRRRRLGCRRNASSSSASHLAQKLFILRATCRSSSGNSTICFRRQKPHGFSIQIRPALRPMCRNFLFDFAIVFFSEIVIVAQKR